MTEYIQTYFNSTTTEIVVLSQAKQQVRTKLIELTSVVL
jgi:hypothetical protein